MVNKTLNLHSDLSPPSFFLLELLDLILERNYFRFDQQFYYQICVVVMGSSVAPSIANLFMASLIYNETINPFFAQISFYG